MKSVKNSDFIPTASLQEKIPAYIYIIYGTANQGKQAIRVADARKSFRSLHLGGL